jgi:hypothetical protein
VLRTRNWSFTIIFYTALASLTLYRFKNALSGGL